MTANKVFLEQLIRLGFRTHQICERANISKDELDLFIKENNIICPRACNRRFYLDDNYFEVIDTPEKSYWLGFLYADGSIHEKNYSYRISVVLKDTDFDHLLKFKEALKSEQPIVFSKNDYIYKNKTKTRRMVRFAVVSKKLCHDLMRLGCVPNKGFSLKFPEEDVVSPHLLRHFVRGYFDGDGCICLSKGWKGLSIISSKFFIDSLKIVMENLGFEKIDINEHYYTKGMFYLNIDRYSDILKFMDWIYEDDTVSLKRKKDIFLRIKNIYDNKTNTIAFKIAENFKGRFFTSEDIIKEYGFSVVKCGYICRFLSRKKIINFISKRAINNKFRCEYFCP